MRLLGCLSLVLGLFVSFLLAGNAALVYLLLEATKETKTSADNTLKVAGTNETVRVSSADTHPAEGGLLVDSYSSSVVRTAPALEKVPMRIAPLLPLDNLAAVATIMITKDATSDTFAGSYTQTYKITSFQVYHALYMIFFCANGDTITIDRGSVYVTDAVSGARHYTCSSNAECASFLAAGVDVDDLDLSVQAAMTTYLNATALASNQTNATVLLSNWIGAFVDIDRRRELNYAGHLHADGSGGGCKVTKRGVHKEIVAGYGTPMDPYVYRTIEGDYACDYYSPNHHHQSGEPCSMAARRHLFTREGAAVDALEFVRHHRRLQTPTSASVLNDNTEVLVCPETEQAMLVAIELEITDSTATAGSWGGQNGRRLAPSGAVLCAKSLWNVYEQVFAGPIWDAIERHTQRWCKFASNRESIKAASKKDCAARREASYGEDKVVELLTSYMYDVQEATGFTADEMVAEATALIMGWYDACGASCDKPSSSLTVASTTKKAMKALTKKK